jgi:YVTN family beta-propeller protein
MKFSRVTKTALFITAVSIISATAQVNPASFVNFEAAQTNPIRLSTDGTRLFAVNTPDARLSVFDVTQSAPVLTKEIPVGIGPVSVQPRSTDEAWVVNQVSDTISIVSLSRGIVTDTIQVKDEPADVVFGGNQLAFVTVSRSNEIRVFDAISHALITSVSVRGINPRAIAVSRDGTKVYAAFALSGNRTTIIPASLAPPQPNPTNTKLPKPPQVGLIVDATDPTWASAIKYTMPDNGVVEIDTGTFATRYFSRVGSVNLGLAIRPDTGDLYVSNTNARNLVRFEPNVRGHSVDNRVSTISLATGTVTAFDLNPGTNYTVLPNPAAKATALAQPAALVFDPSGAYFYVAAFGTDRVARVASDGSILKRIEMGNATGSTVDPRNKRGPRGLALNALSQRLYVLNRISNTISVIDVSADRIIQEISVGKFDPTPAVIRSGRGFLYDAKLSGNGTESCASCHIDADMDLLAWHLGDPNGTMQTVKSGKQTFQFHPMKGPMATQTLRGLSTLQPFHWRGDKADFLAFNPAFDSLMGGTQLSSADMTAYRDFINTIAFQPNPNQNLDRSLPASFAGGNPAAGRNTFLTEPFASSLACNSCHTADPGPGTNLAIIPANILQESQALKVPELRNLYQKVNFDNTALSSSTGGFGFIHDGSMPDIFAFLSQPVFQSFANDTVRKTNLNAFLMCFDTGTAPAVGYSRTVTGSNVANPSLSSDWTLLERQAAAANIDLIVKGVLDGQLRGLLYRPVSNDYLPDKTGIGPFTRQQLQTKLQADATNAFTVMGVPPGSGIRMGIDRNLNGVLDSDEAP